MQPHDRKDFLSCLMGAAEVYGKEVSESAARVWWDLLRRYDIEAVQTAFGVHMSDPDTGQFLPKPADVIRRINGTSQDAAMRAWANVDKAVRQVGPWASVTFDDAVTMRVLADMGGWTFLGDKTDDSWPFVAKEFENRYRGYKQRGEAPEHPPLLLGYTDVGNVREGFGQGQPVLIGDPEKAQQVFLAGQSRSSLGVTRNAGPLRLVYAKP